MVGLDEPAHQGLHRRLVRRREVPLHVDLTQCLTQAGLHQADAALPAGPQLVCPLERAAVEVEVLLHEGRRQQGGPSVNDVPGGPGLEILQVGLLPDAGRVGKIVGLGDDGLLEEGGLLDAGAPGGRTDPLAPLVPGQVRGRVHDLPPGHRVVHLLHVTAGDAVPVALGQGGLHGHDPFGEVLTRGAEGVRQTRQRHHPGHVLNVGLAQRGLSLLPVVGLVRQPQPRLPHPARVALRVIDVHLDIRADHAHEADGRHLSQRSGQLLLGGGAQHRRQLLSQRLGPELLQVGLVHEGLVEGTDSAPVGGQDLRGPLGRHGGELLGELLDDLAAGGLGLVAQSGEGAAAGTIRRDLGSREPLAVDETEQVVLGAHRGVGVRRLQHAGEDRVGGRGAARRLRVLGR